MNRVMAYEYLTLDVFTDRAFGGNPLAVVADAQGLNTAQMQTIAREFNYSETTFVLPPKNPNRPRKVQIFDRAEFCAPETPLDRHLFSVSGVDRSSGAAGVGVRADERKKNERPLR